ncbi:MAG TPA: DUF2071 domain-containing protein [Terriglobales bacterium]|nr:DUF2071 domain-containing protein [Terriglobales bacterium]
MEVLSQTAHRPWPLPNLPWVMVQRWHDLLFAHWPVPPEKIRPLVPRELELDTFEDKAWVGVIPFWMSGVRFRGIPSIPTASTFPELNVRTYVCAPQQPNKPGVYFFSLDAASVLAVLGARAGAGLPYFWAEMKAESAGDEIRYRSIRRQSPRGADLLARYRPTGPACTTKTAVENFVTERYCLYVVRSGVVHRIQIHHLPWPLQPAEAEFEKNTMAAAHGIQLPPAKPILQFSKFLEVYIFAPERIG